MKPIFTVKQVNLFLILAIIIYPLLWIYQGIDLTDSGYVMFYYKRIFSNPEVISNMSPIVLTSVLGGIWLKLFPFMEYTSCKLGSALVVIFINFLLFKIFKDIFKNKTLLLLSLLVSTICITRPFVQFLNYSSLTVLFFVLGSYFLYKGIVNKSNINVLISSVILSLSIFVRFPNILGLSFVFIFWFWSFINIQTNKCDKKEEFLNSLKFSGIFLAGYLITALIFLLGLKLTGVLGFYLDGFKNLLFYAKSNTHHSVFMLLGLYTKTYFKALLVGVNFVGIIFVFGELIKNNSKNKNIFRFFALIILIFTLLCLNTVILYNLPLNHTIFSIRLFAETICLLFAENFWQYMGMFLPLGIFLFIPFFNLFDKKIKAKLKLLSFMGLFVAIFSFAGSDGYFYNIPGYWFLAVISVYCVLNPAIFKNSSFNIQHKIKKTGLILVIFLSIFSIATKGTCFYDSTNKFSLNTNINNKMFWGSYTTKEKAFVLKNFIKAYPNYIKKDDLLLAWPSIPLLHYITETKPALKSPWPAVMDYRIFKKNMEELEKNKEFPVILISKYLTTNRDWPKELIDNPYSYYAGNCSSSLGYVIRDNCEEDKMIKIFIKNNKYYKIWEDDFFIMYKK